MKLDQLFRTGLSALAIFLVSCGDEQKRMGKGFRLPEGDADRGKTTFVELKCHRCHSVKGVELPEPEKKSAVHFQLGGEVEKVKNYGELVTAIIQPQHVVSEAYLATLEKETQDGVSSPMPDYNATMTVRQMTDLVTFLHTHYERALPAYEEFPYYGP